ncbi:hypothetical protein VE04_03768 [Pseudogymnoascus sp. 24MN13]|nr:hypothetical protein VE04_03768 [Pseudogymnoascus sp. 24MN13]
MENNVFCCSNLQPYRPTTLDNEPKFTDFISWAKRASLGTSCAAEKSSDTPEATEHYPYAVQLVRQVNYGHLESKRYFVPQDNPARDFVEITADELVDVVSFEIELAFAERQTRRYFSTPYQKYASLKKHLLYAPIFRNRHNREFQLSTAINMGVLPTRFQLLFLTAYLAANAAFCVIRIHWDQPYHIVVIEVRRRSGILAVVNMVPLFIMATRNNPLIYWLDMSFDTFNLLHRWFGRIVVLETLLHSLAWLVSTAKLDGWADVANVLTTDQQVTWGFISTVALVAISIQSVPFIRHAFYETFKHIHIGLAIVSVIGLWYHLKLANLPQIKLLIGAIVVWAIERSMRILRLVYRNVGSGGTKAFLWIIQSPEHLEWIRRWMTEILAMDKRRDVLRITLFISRPRSTKEIHSPSATVQMFPGRPNMNTLIDMEIESQIGAMGVSVCGSGLLSDDVRSVVRRRQSRTNIDFIEEAFTW